MAFTPESPFSSFDESFVDPVLYDDDVLAGASPVWDWNPLFDGSSDNAPMHPNHHHVSFPVSDSSFSENDSLNSSPWSGNTSFSSPYSPAAYVEDWSLLEETVRLLPAAPAAAPAVPHHPPPAAPHQLPTPSMSTLDVALMPQSRTPLSPSASPDPGPARSRRVPIQREPSRVRKTATASGSHSADSRHYCPVPRCRSSFTRHSDLHRHNLDVHSRSGKHFECDVCPHYSRRCDKVKEHCQKMHHQPRGLERYTVVVDRA